MPTLDLGSVVGPQGPQGETGPKGEQGVQGPAGAPATINGKNALTIAAGRNVELKQEGGTLEIGAVVPGKNLLLNWDFRKPVNRNGKTEYINSHDKVSVDCWSTGEGSLTIGNGECILKGPENGIGAVFIAQDIQKNIAGKVCTLTFLTSSGIVSKTGVFPDGSNDIATSINGWNAVMRYRTIDNSPKVLLRQDDTSSEIGILAVKLELGTQQTLARQNENGEWEIIDPPDYDLQYALCSQYSPITGEFVGLQHSNPNLIGNGHFLGPINQRGKDMYSAVT